MTDPVAADSRLYLASQSDLFALRTDLAQGKPSALPKIRDHGWKLLRAVTQPASPGSTLPRWLSWCTKQELLGDPAKARPACNGSLTRLKGFESLTFTLSKSEILNETQPADTHHGPPDASELHVGSVLFDPNAAHRFAQPALGKSPPLSKVKLWPPDVSTILTGVSGEQRHLDPFPNTSVVVKPVWRVFPRRPATIGVWNGRVPVGTRNGQAALIEGNFPEPAHIDVPRQDPCGPQGPPAIAPGTHGKPTLGNFFFLPICKELYNNLSGIVSSTIGDYLVLEGFHVITRETEDWVWTTFWWHDNPEQGPFASGRPRDLARSVWGNYLMNITLGPDRVSAAHGIPVSNVFNPYSELALQNGIHTDCFGCHQIAAAPLEPGGGLPARDDPPYTRLTDNAAVDSLHVRTEFLWSIAREVQAANSLHP